MTFLVLIILAVIWAAVLIPPWIQNRRERRPANSITSFRNQLSVLERRAAASSPTLRTTRPSAYRARHAALHGQGQHATGPQHGQMPAHSQAVGYGPPMARSAGRPGSSRAAMPRHEARRRRRDVFLTLVGGVVLTLVLAFVIGGPVWFLHLGLDLVLATYTVMLVQMQQRAAERAMKVRHLPDRRPAPQSVHGGEPALLLRRTGN